MQLIYEVQAGVLAKNQASPQQPPRAGYKKDYAPERDSYGIRPKAFYKGEAGKYNRTETYYYQNSNMHQARMGYFHKVSNTPKITRKYPLK